MLDTIVKDSNLLQMLDIIKNVIADLPYHNKADRSHTDKRSEHTIDVLRSCGILSFVTRTLIWKSKYAYYGIYMLLSYDLN